MRLRALFVLLLAGSAAAQQRALFDVDDFVDPRQHDVPLFSSRLVIGGAWNFVDDYRPANEDVGFVHVANSFYVRNFQFDYKHSEVLGEDPPPLHACACDPPIYFPTPPPRDATPAAPPAGSRNTLQAAWYVPVGGEDRIPVMLRYRLTWSRQAFDVPVTAPQSDDVLSRRSGREQTFGLDGDVYVPMFGRYGYGSFQYAKNSRRGPVEDRTQQELVYTSRPPGTTWKGMLFRATLSVGAVSDRGGTAINMINPYFEVFLHERTTRANFHLVWSPQFLNSGARGWETTHQIALFADRALLLKLVR